MFGNHLPHIVKMYLRNGKMYQGTCSKSQRLMNGISHLIAANGLTETQKLVFTYFGEGNFFVMIIGNSDVELMLMLDSDSGY